MKECLILLNFKKTLTWIAEVKVFYKRRVVFLKNLISKYSYLPIIMKIMHFQFFVERESNHQVFLH